MNAKPRGGSWSRLRVAARLVLLACAMTPPILARAGDPVVRFDADDPEMARAIGKP